MVSAFICRYLQIAKKQKTRMNTGKSSFHAGFAKVRGRGFEPPQESNYTLFSVF
nr:MAG TPA: hypothetical protein [Bacteriophage sp.]